MKRSSAVVASIAILLLGVAVVLSNCGGGGGGGGDNAASCAAAAFTLNGNWRFTWTDGPNTCGDPTGGQQNYDYVLVQNGSSITADPDYTGTLCGNTLTLRGTYALGGGGTTTETITATVSSATAWSGTSTWSWTLGGYTCNGTDSIIGAKL